MNSTCALVWVNVIWHRELLEKKWSQSTNDNTRVLKQKFSTRNDSTPHEIFILFFSVLFTYLFYFTILYWFCHTLTWIRHGCTCVSHPEPASYLYPCPIPLGHPNAPALSTLYHAPNLDWWFVSHMIIYMFQCHSPILPSPSPTESKRLFYTSVSLWLSHIQGYHYHLSKFHIYALVYYIGFFFLAYFTWHNRFQYHLPQ